MDPAYDIACYLDSEGIGILGKDIFANLNPPPKPDSLLMISNSGTYESASPNLNYKYPTIQIVSRGSIGKRGECVDRLLRVDKAIHGLTNTKINSSLYVYIFCNSEPVDLAFDETRRPYLGANYRINVARDNN